MNLQEENAALRAQIKKLEKELLQYRMSKEDKQALILEKLKEKKKLLTSDVIQIAKCKTYTTARVLMVTLAGAHPELVRFSQGAKRGGSVLFWNGKMSVQEKAEVIVQELSVPQRTIYLSQVRRLCRIESEEELQAVVRLLPRYITLVRTQDKDRWHLWRRY